MKNEKEKEKERNEKWRNLTVDIMKHLYTKGLFN